MRIKNLGFMNYPNYEVDDKGNVWSLNYNHTGERRKLTPVPSEAGYLRVLLWNDGKKKLFLVHQLVGWAFLDWRMWGLTQYNHKNEVKTDNRVENIEPCTQLYNNTYGTRLERVANKLCKKVSQFTKSGLFIKTYNSLKEASELTGINRKNITHCLRGETKSAGNFVWKYDNICDEFSGKMNEINQFSKDGDLIKTYSSISEASKLTGISKSIIFYCLKGKRKSAGGYIWRYA
jgi:hypothetical protein